MYLLFVALYSCKSKEVYKSGREGEALPAFNILLTDSVTQYNTKQLPPHKPLVVLYFRPDCPYCRAQTEDIVKSMKLLKGIQFCFLSYAPIPDIKAYEEYFHLKKFSNVLVGQDESAFFIDYFKIPGVPYLVLYAKDGKLQQAFIGSVKTNAIKKAIGS